MWGLADTAVLRLDMEHLPFVHDIVIEPVPCIVFALSAKWRNQLQIITESNGCNAVEKYRAASACCEIADQSQHSAQHEHAISPAVS